MENLLDDGRILSTAPAWRKTGFFYLSKREGEKIQQ